MASGGKWLGFVTAIWVQAISGNNYAFANYSHALKTLMVLTQLELNNLSVAKDIGKAFGLLSGIASDIWPPSVILLIGAFMGFIGYGGQWLVVSQRISPLPYWLMCVLLCLGGNSSTWMNTAVLVTCMRNFPQNRGPVSGILKGYVGLSTAIFTDTCTALFSSSPSSFLLMLTIVPAIICFIASLSLHQTQPASNSAEVKQETQFLNLFNIIAMIVAFYLLAYDITGLHGHLLSFLFTLGLLILLAMPLLVPLCPFIFKSNLVSDAERQIDEPLLLAENNNKEEEEDVDSQSGGEVIKRQQPVIGEEHTIIEMVKTVDFWVLFMSFLCGVGTGMCVMNNMGQIGLASGYTDVSMFISFISIWGFFGRIISGSLSEYFIKKSGMARPFWNAASQLLMVLGFMVMAMSLPGSLYIGSMIVGICYGVRLTITTASASELFGLKYYGLLYNILILNLPLGSFLFSGLVAGNSYDAEAARQNNGGGGGGGNTCIGSQCYMLVFVIMAFVCVLGCGLDLVLAIRTKKIYSKIHEEKTS